MSQLFGPDYTGQGDAPPGLCGICLGPLNPLYKNHRACMGNRPCVKCGSKKERNSKGHAVCRQCSIVGQKRIYWSKARSVCGKCGVGLREPRSKQCKPCAAKVLYRPVCGVCGSEDKRRDKNGKVFCAGCAAKNSRKRYALLSREERMRWRGDPAKCHARARQAKIKRRGYEVLGQHTESEWQAIVSKQKGRCASCNSKTKLTRDHIVPVSKGGSDYAVNIQGLCLPCNCSKQDRMEGISAISLFDRLSA